jgi:DNA-3-methyladenine glycosylase II
MELAGRYGKFPRPETGKSDAPSREIPGPTREYTGKRFDHAPLCVLSAPQPNVSHDCGDFCGLDARGFGSAVIYAPRGLDEGIAALAGETVFAAILERAGAPRFRRRANGFPTLLHIILEQQVSIDAAAAMHRRLAETCRPLAPEPFLALDDPILRRCGFSRQKMSYARGLADAVASGRLDFAELAAMPDDDARAALVALKGIGRWSAEIYLIFALGRPDIWPAADLGLQLAVAECLGLSKRPREKDLREIGEQWCPWRSVAACLFWQSYLHARNRAAPVLAPELYAEAE